MLRFFVVALCPTFFLLAASGCVERAMVITSDPPGANVVVNQQWHGKTPYTMPFRHYGVYDIRLEHPGVEENGKMVRYYPLQVSEPIVAPGYQKLGADFVSEVMVPTTIHDKRELFYRLERIETADELSDVLTRADQMRQSSQTRAAMRAEKDALRRAQKTTGTPTQETPVETYGEPYVSAPEIPVSTDIDATPPSPDSMPVFQ